MISLVFGFPSTVMLKARFRSLTVHARHYKFSPSEITLKQGQKVKLVFVSDDVPHGVVVEDLSDLDIAKSQRREIAITPMKIGDFKGPVRHTAVVITVL